MRPSFPQPMFGQTEIRTNPHLTVTTEDWSGCRSPSRARRREKRGFRQRVVRCVEPMPGAVVVMGVIYMHPDTHKAFVAETARRDRREAQFLARPALEERVSS